MINYETIKSVYDDKLTLMQWLNKVQEALKDATAVSFDVNKRGDATLTFSIVFDDGTELETDPIILEQGESVESATLRNGHLILTLTNGDELDAGNMGAVSSFSIDANQHLIVTYQDGSANDLGAIFTGNININGNITGVNVNVSEKLSLKELDDIDGRGYINVLKPIRALEKIYDSAGRIRFIDDYIQPQTITGVNITYAKWSLSGTHIMFVIAGTMENGTELTSGSLFGYTISLPNWILDKITSVFGSGWIEVKAVNLTDNDFQTQEWGIAIRKFNQRIEFYSTANVSVTGSKGFRVQFDLLVDAE